MTVKTRWTAALTAVFNDNSPWGNKGNAPTGDAGGPRNPWDMPPAGKPRVSAAQSALDRFMDGVRSTFGGGGGGFSGGPMGSPKLWGYGVAGVILLWLLLTCVHSIDAQERGVVTRFGSYVRTLEPGISLTLPAPFEAVQAVDVQNIRTFNIPDGAGEKLVLTGDQNILDMEYSVRWDIKSPEQFLFQLEDPEATIRAVAESAMRAAIANVTLNDAFGKGRSAIQDEVANRMQSILDSYRSGVRVRGVAIKDAAPPEKVNDAFKSVAAAGQEAQQNIAQANQYAQQIIAKAEGDAGQFNRVYSQYRLAPEVTRRRMYYETMEDVLSKVDKTIVEPGVTPYMPLSGPTRTLPAPPVATGAAQ